MCEFGVDGVSEMMPATSGVSAGTPSVSKMSCGVRRPSAKAASISDAGKNFSRPSPQPGA